METASNKVIQGNAVQLEDVQAAFEGETFCKLVDEILQQWESGTDEQLEQLKTYGEELRRSILAAVEDVMDADDLRMVLCHLYIKQKCEWIVMNNQINYSLLCRGIPQEDMMYRAALLAQHLAPMEPLVGQEAIEGIASFLAQPITTEA